MNDDTRNIEQRDPSSELIGATDDDAAALLLRGNLNDHLTCM